MNLASNWTKLVAITLSASIGSSKTALYNYHGKTWTNQFVLVKDETKMSVCCNYKNR